MKECKIIERTNVSGSIEYVIKQRHWLFSWKWVDAWANSWDIGCQSSYSTLKEAKEHLRYFDGTKPTEKEITQ